jgi:two-component system phosphate regulon sensor histidine kinase PhoR
LNSTIIIEIDPEKIKQALENLISNAVKYSNENRKIIIRLFSDKKNICLEVEDFGIGIPEDQQNHIFEKFFRVGQSETRNISGTGLGLTVVKEIVEAHDGQIKVSGNIGIGSKFSIFLKTSNKQ